MHLLLEVKGDVGELLLDITDDLTLGSGGERVTHTWSRSSSSSQSNHAPAKSKRRMAWGESITFIDGDSVGNTISRIHDDTSGMSRSVQRQHGLDGNVHGRGVEGLEHDLGHLLTVGLGVKRGLGQKNGVLLRGDTELVVKGVVPDLLHIVPVGDNTVLDRGTSR